MATSVSMDDANRPLADYTISVNELLDSGIAEVETFGRNYMRRIFGIPLPPRESSISLPHMRNTQTTSPPLKRERRDSFTPDISDDEEQRMHAAYLLNLASPEANSRTPSESSYQARKKPKSRYGNSMSQPFTQMVRPAYEFMSDVAPLSDMRYPHHGYTTPHSPPQSPPEIVPRLRARPGRCARKAQGCNENTKFRPVISDWTCYKNYEPCPKDSQVGWCNKCWCNKGHYSEEDFYRRKFELLEDQIAVWAEDFHVQKFEVWLQSRDGAAAGGANSKTVVDPDTALRYVVSWRDDWERTGRTPNIKIRPV